MNEEQDVVPDPGLRDLAADTAGLFDPALLADIPLLQILKAVMQLPLRNNCARKEGGMRREINHQGSVGGRETATRINPTFKSEFTRQLEELPKKVIIREFRTM